MTKEQEQILREEFDATIQEISEWVAETPTDIVNFYNKVLHYYFDDDNISYELDTSFQDVIYPAGGINFISGLQSFLTNCLLDDSSFSITDFKFSNPRVYYDHTKKSGSLEDLENLLDFYVKRNQTKDLKKEELKWRLPTKEELDIIYENLHKKGIGNFISNWYLSSLEYDTHNAFGRHFGFGDRIGIRKGYYYQVRVVRTFTSTEDYKIGQETATGFVFNIIGTTIFECKKEDEVDVVNWYEAMEKFKGEKL